MATRLHEARVHVIAPFGRDAELIAECLRQAKIPCEVAHKAGPALPDLSNGTGALIVAEEAFTPEAVQEFSSAVRRQPSWSDSPLIILTKPGAGRSQFARLAEQLRDAVGHATLLERPVRPETLISAVITALRARQRQYQVRDTLEQLRQSEERYRSLATAASSVVWAADREGRFNEALPLWESFTGQTFEQYRGFGWLNAVHEADRLHAERVFREAIAQARPFQLEYRLLCQDGRYRCVHAHGVPVFSGPNELREWVGTCTDIQEKKDSEAALRKSERLALAGQFAATIAHEINNPLEAVTNLIYLIRMKTRDETVRQYAAMAERELTRVAELSGQTLRFYKRATEATKTDVSEVLESLLKLFGPKMARLNIALQKKITNTCPVLAFSNELRQLFANILSNAIDATPRGRIEVRAREWRNRQGELGVRVTIADTGGGIPAHLRDAIFNPFFTTKGEAGTGLGLWVCADVVARHNGRIVVRSRTNAPSGTVFTLFLPCDHQPMPQAAEPAGAASPPVNALMVNMGPTSGGLEFL